MSLPGRTSPRWLWFPARQSQPCVAPPQHQECCTPWNSPAEGQGQSLPGCSPAHLSHSSRMSLSCSHWSRTSCDVYHQLPCRFHPQLSPGLKAKPVLLSLGLQEAVVTPWPCASNTKTWSKGYPKLQGGGTHWSNPKREIQRCFNPVTVLQQILLVGKAFPLFPLWLESLTFSPLAAWACSLKEQEQNNDPIPKLLTKSAGGTSYMWWNRKADFVLHSKCQEQVKFFLLNAVNDIILRIVQLLSVCNHSSLNNYCLSATSFREFVAGWFDEKSRPVWYLKAPKQRENYHQFWMISEITCLNIFIFWKSSRRQWKAMPGSIAQLPCTCFPAVCPLVSLLGGG